MRKFLLPIAAVPLLLVLGWQFELDISLFFHSFFENNPRRANATSIHLAAVSGPFARLSMEKKPVFERKTENLIFITLDGFRWQELFGGADSVLINDPAVSNDTAELRRLFWAKASDERRRKLLPFFWENLAPTGKIVGNRWLGSRCEVSNAFWFSYPGYAEMLCGLADDRIRSNRKVDNPHPTVFEFLNQKPRLHGRVAIYASWDVFPSIYNENESGLSVNAGVETPDGPLNDREKRLDELQKQIPQPWPGVRDDLYTFHLGFEFLKKNKPRVLAFHFDGTDDSAHDGHYDAYLKYANQIDFFLKILWNYLETDPFYRQKTTLVLTCDHGRGEAAGNEWRNHGRTTAGSNQIWMAAFGPETPAVGEVRGEHPIIFQKQIGPTLAALLGYDFLPDGEAVGQPIRAFFSDENALNLSYGD